MKPYPYLSVIVSLVTKNSSSEGLKAQKAPFQFAYKLKENNRSGRRQGWALRIKTQQYLGLCMGHGNTELIRKTEPKLSRTENTVDFLTLSEPNRTGKIFWYGSGSYMLSIPRTVPNCTELKNRN